MNNGIKELVQSIKGRLKTTSSPSYIACLNENDITLSDALSGGEVGRFNIEENMGMLEFIRDTSKKIVKEIPIEYAVSRITVHDFAGYENVVRQGPITLLFKTKDNESFSLRFSSSKLECKQWLIDCIHYFDSKKESTYSEDFKELDSFIEALELGNLDIEESQNSSGNHK